MASAAAAAAGVSSSAHRRRRSRSGIIGGGIIGGISALGARVASLVGVAALVIAHRGVPA